MPGKLEILMNMIFPPKFQEGDVHSFKFVSLIHKKKMATPWLDEHVYRLSYMKDGKYFVRKITHPSVLDFSFFLGEIKEIMGMSIQEFRVKYIITASPEFDLAASYFIANYIPIVEVLNRVEEFTRVATNTISGCVDIKDTHNPISKQEETIMTTSTPLRHCLNISDVIHNGDTVTIVVGAGFNVIKAIVSLDHAKLKFGLTQSNPFNVLTAIIPDLFSLNASQAQMFADVTPDELSQRLVITHSLGGEKGELVLDELSKNYDIWTQFRRWLYDNNDVNHQVQGNGAAIKPDLVDGPLGKMIQSLFNEEVLAELHGVTRVNGMFKGNEYSFGHSHVLGNHHIEGYLERFKLRILKKSDVVICYLTTQKEWDNEKRPAAIFLSKQKEDMFKWINDLAENTPK